MLKLYIVAMCITFTATQFSNITIPGTYYVVGIYSLCADDHETMNKISFLHHLAITERLKKNTEDFGYIAFDVCNDTERLVDLVLSLQYGSNYRIDNRPGQEHMYRKCHCTNTTTNILLIVGYMDATMTKLAADILQISRILFVSYQIKGLYPTTYHQPFFQPADAYVDESNEIFQFLSPLFWNCFILVCLKDEHYDCAVLFKIYELLTVKSEPCIFYQEAPSDDISYQEEITKRKEFLLESINIVSGSNKAVRKFLNLAAERNMSKSLWIVHDREYFDKLESKYVDKRILHGMLIVRSISTNEDDRSPQPLASSQTSNDRWTSHFLNHYSVENDYKVINLITLDELFYYRYVYVSMSFLEQAIYVARVQTTNKYSFSKSLTEDIWGLDEKETDFYVYVRQRFMSELFDAIKFYNCYTNERSRSCGDIPNSEIMAYNLIWPREYNTTPLFSCKIKRCDPGSESYHTKLQRNTTQWKNEVSWRCRRCKPNYIRSIDHINCIQCTGLLAANIEQTQCIDPYKETYLNVGDVASIIGICVSTSGFVLCLFIGIVLLVYRKTPCVQASDFLMSILQVFAIALLFSVNTYLFLSFPKKAICLMRPLIVGTMFSFCIAISISKIHKLLHAFKATTRISKREMQVNKATQVFVVILLVLGSIFLYAVTLLQTPVDRAENLYTKDLVREVICNSDDHIHVQILYVFFLFVFCNIQGFRGRSLPSNFNESKYILYSSLSASFCFLLILPLYYSQNRQRSKTAVHLILINLAGFTFIMISYVNKLYVIIFRPDLNTKKVFREEIMDHVQKKVKQQIKK